MADDVVARSPLAEIEDRLGVRPLEELHAKRREVIAQLAPLRARYGAGGTWEAERKVLVSGLAMKARAVATRDSLKVTEAWLTDASHDDPSYIARVTTATQDRAQMIALENQMQDIEDEIRRSDAVIRYLSAEARL